MAVGPSGTKPSKRLSLSDMVRGSKGLPPRIVFYGRPGFGKTSIGAFSQEPFFLLSPGETGLHTLIDSGLVPPTICNIEITDWQSLMGIVEELTTTAHNRKTLVIDTINGMEALANQFTRETEYPGEKGGKEFDAYMSGYRVVASGCWKELLCSLDKLRTEKEMAIIMLAHTGITKSANPSGGDYSKWAPAFVGHWSWDITFGWADAVLFGDFDTAVVKAKPADAKGKASSKGERLIHTGWSPDYDAKGGRIGLPSEITAPDSAEATWKLLSESLIKKVSSNG